MTTDPPCTWSQAMDDGNGDEVEKLEDEISEAVCGEDVGVSAPALAFALVNELQVKCATPEDARASFDALVIEMREWLEAGIEEERKALH